jgi:hypothetical protein
MAGPKRKPNRRLHLSDPSRPDFFIGYISDGGFAVARRQTDHPPTAIELSKQGNWKQPASKNWHR